MLPVLKDYNQFLKCQDLFCRFTAILCEKIPSNTSALEILAPHHLLIQKEPELTHHIYQTAMEAAFYKKRFPDADLEPYFNYRFKIVDPYGLNKGVSDSSTFSNLLILDHIVNLGHFENSKIVVYSTPLVFGTAQYKQRQYHMAYEYVKDSKTVTVNTNAEVRIAHRIYDIKHTDHTSTANSHLYPWTYEKIQRHTQNHLKSLLENLERRNEHSDIHKELLDNLKTLCEDNSIAWPEKNKLWNEFMEANFTRIPKDYPLPMVIQMTNYPYVLKCDRSLLEKVRLSPDTVDNHFKARQAIAGICAHFGVQHFRNAVFATDGAISMDILPKTEELD